MAYPGNFNGDVIQKNLIEKLLNSKTAIIPGVTSNIELSVSESGETVHYFLRSKSDASTGKLGDKLTASVTGAKRKSFTFTDAEHIHVVIPGVNHKTITADVIADKLLQESVTRANKINANFVTTVEAGVKKGNTQYEDSTPMKSLLNLRAEYIVANKALGLAPTVCFVDPYVFADLKSANALVYKEVLVGQGQLTESQTRAYFGDMMIIENSDLTGKVVMFADKCAFGARNIESLEVVSAAPLGYPGGTLISGEIGYINGLTFDATDIADNTLECYQADSLIMTFAD